MNRFNRTLIALAALVSFLFVSGPAIAAPSSAPKSSTARFASYSPDSEECAFLTIINSYRKSNGLGSLALSVTLGGAAEHHSQDMVSHNYFSHTLYNGTSWSTNILNYGYPSNSGRAENIAAGHATAESTFTQWKNSAPHNANMLNGSYKAIGIGRAQGTSSNTYSWYWTTTFGSVVDSTIKCSGSSDISGSALTIVSGGRTSNSVSALLAFDGDTSSNWHTTSPKPASAYIYFDLGSSKTVGTLKWFFSKGGGADSFDIQISTDKSTWTTLTTRTAAHPGAWQTLSVAKKARYIRFYFRNPNGDNTIGYLAEVRVYS